MARKRGGQTTYSQAVADAICQRIADGEPLREICRSEGMPAWRTIYDWMAAHEEFAASIARARDLGADAIAESILEIVDDGTNDWMEKLGADGQPIGWQLNGEHVQRSKLRAEVRLKLLAKWNPKKYGEKVQQEHTGPDGGPVQALIRFKLTDLT